MSADSIINLISGGTGALGAVVIFLALILASKLHTDQEFQREVNRGDKLEANIAEKDRTIVAMSERADAAVKASEVIANAFAAADSRRTRVR